MLGQYKNILEEKIGMRLYKKYLFFKRHAGYVVGRCALGALALARAEIWLENNEDIVALWEYDDNGYDSLGDHEYWCSDARRVERGYNQYGEKRNFYGLQGACEHEILCCLLILRSEEENDVTLASLGGIIDADRNYRRVVEAELACEAMEQIKIDNNTYLYEGIT